MIKQIIGLGIFVIVVQSVACQDIFLRHDTVFISSGDANWLIPPAAKTNKLESGGSAGSGETVIEWILTALKKGKLRAVDPSTGAAIPAARILSWKMPVDTVPVYNNNFELTGYRTFQNDVDPKQLTQLRLQVDWWLSRSSGKLYSRLNWIEPMKPVHLSSGMFIGYEPLCRIIY
jgi:hypothetical protein